MYSVCYGKVIPTKYLVSESRIEAPASVLCNASATAERQSATACKETVLKQGYFQKYAFLLLWEIRLPAARTPEVTHGWTVFQGETKTET